MVDQPIITSIDSTATHRADRPMLGIMLRIGAMAMLGIMFALVKLASQKGVHLTESLFWRQVSGLPVVLIWLYLNNDLGSVRTQNPLGHSLRMILGISAMALNFLAMTMLPMAQATTIGFATPIFATMLAALLLHEVTGLFRWSAILIGFVGVLIALQPDGGNIAPIGSLVALSGALITACVTIQLRRMSRTESTGAIVFWFSLSSLIPLGVAMSFFATAHDVFAWSLIAGLSLSGAVAQILLTSALRHAPVAAILTMDYSALIWSTLFGFVFFGDIAGNSVWLGAPIIVGAGLTIVWREHFIRNRAA